MAKEKPLPRPSDVTAPFWAATRERKFLLQYDPRAGRYQFYPRPVSVFGNSDALEWREAKGTGKLIAHTLCRAPAPGFEAEAPYLLGLVELDEGPRVFARLVNVAPDAIAIGGRMRIVWQDASPDLKLYAFEPVS
jgi:uncharacterized OB-fold protein